MAPAATINEIERNADRAFAYALLARLAQSYVVGVLRLQAVASPLEELVAMLTREMVEWLINDESDHCVRIRARLEELHHVLCEFSASVECAKLSALPLPIIPGLIRRVQDGTENLGDVVENIGLARNTEFKNLVSCCASSIGMQVSEDVVGRLQD